MKQEESGDSNVALKFEGLGVCQGKERSVTSQVLSPAFQLCFSHRPWLHPPVLCRSHQHGADASWINFLPLLSSPIPAHSLSAMISVPGETSRLSHTQPRRAGCEQPPGERLPGLCQSQTWVIPLPMAILKCFDGTHSFLVSCSFF